MLRLERCFLQGISDFPGQNSSSPPIALEGDLRNGGSYDQRTEKTNHRITTDRIRVRHYRFFSGSDEKSGISLLAAEIQLTGTKASVHTEDHPAPNCCRNCGKQLTQTPGRKPVKFCSDTCRTHWWNSHLDKVNRKAFYSFTCAHCGTPFTAYGNNHRKYCSHDCYIR